jgi:hypothetical protein
MGLVDSARRTLASAKFADKFLMGQASSLKRSNAKSAWYGARAWDNRYRYVFLKGVEVALAAGIPLVAVGIPALGVPLPPEIGQWAVAVLGAAVVALELIIHGGQYQHKWLLFRATRDALKREDLLYAAKAGCYGTVPAAEPLYAERCDSIMAMSAALGAALEPGFEQEPAAEPEPVRPSEGAPAAVCRKTWLSDPRV